VSETDAIHDVVNGYYDAFGRDSAAASAFFAEPALIVVPGQIILLGTRAEVEATIEGFAGSLKAGGFSHSKLGEHRVQLLNPTTALYSMVAIRMKADGTELQRAGFTYLLHKSDTGWKIYELIATDPDAPDLDKVIEGDRVI